MNLKEKVFNLFGVFVEKIVPQKRIKNILKRILPKKIDIGLIRLGENGDGGYLVPNDLNNIDKNYSAGVGFLTKFEQDLENSFFISSNLLDFNEVDKKIVPNKSQFLKKKLSLEDNTDEISINNWIKDADKEIILKIDIEGDEYAVLTNISEKNLRKIRILVVEFHGLRNFRSHFFLNHFEKILSRLEKIFHSCHLHINNSGKQKKINGYYIPDMIEMTFIRKDRVKNFTGEFTKLPHPLDRRTVDYKDEIFIDPKWYI